jgi:hypothetical protein
MTTLLQKDETKVLQDARKGDFYAFRGVGVIVTVYGEYGAVYSLPTL